jgi:chromate reductase
MSQPRIVAFAGSLRAGSFNKVLLSLAAEAARGAGAQVTAVDLRDLSLPLFDEDLEAASGMPAGARQLKTLMRESDGLIIASPEYNSSVTAALKNAIDWVTRSEARDEPPVVACRGKVAALCSASPGALGGLRGLVTLRSILGNLGMFVLPDQVCVSTAHQAFDDQGRLTDERKSKQLTALAANLVETSRRLRS